LPRVEDLDPPRWDAPIREVGLVALQAAVLTRRIFLPAAGAEDVAPEQWQMILALALTGTASYTQPAASVESLAVQLSLDRDHAHELLYDLLTRDLVVFADEDDPEAPAGFRLSPSGWAAARAYVERASRFLPGWPPRESRAR
jgi:hypothetical protein